MHEHEFNGDCGCGAHHHGEQRGDCGCGAHHHGEHHQACDWDRPLTGEERGLLSALAGAGEGPLPVARFLLRSSKSEHLEAVALAPVLLSGPGDSMEFIKATGKLLTALEELGMVELDYDVPLEGYGYEKYYASDAYQFFQETVAQVKARSDYIYDLGELEGGSLLVTARGAAEAAVRL